MSARESPFGRVGDSAGDGRFAVALAEENRPVSFTGGHRHRSAGIQVLLSDHDNVDFECGDLGYCVGDPALRRCSLRGLIVG